MLIQRNCYIQCKYPLRLQNVCIIDIVLLLSLLSFSICCYSQYQCYWYYYTIIDKLSGNLKEYPSFKGKYSIFLSCTYDKF